MIAFQCHSQQDELVLAEEATLQRRFAAKPCQLRVQKRILLSGNELHRYPSFSPLNLQVSRGTSVNCGIQTIKYLQKTYNNRFEGRFPTGLLGTTKREKEADTKLRTTSNTKRDHRSTILPTKKQITDHVMRSPIETYHWFAALHELYNFNSFLFFVQIKRVVRKAGEVVLEGDAVVGHQKGLDVRLLENAVQLAGLAVPGSKGVEHVEDVEREVFQVGHDGRHAAARARDGRVEAVLGARERLGDAVVDLDEGLEFAGLEQGVQEAEVLV